MSKCSLLLGLGICIGLIGCGFTQERVFKTVKVVTDFEDGVDEWDPSMSTVKKIPKIEVTDDAKSGKKAGKITLFASDKSSDWTLLKCDIEKWPADGEYISFWIKSTKNNAPVQVKLSEMTGDHQNYEGFKKDIEVGTKWQNFHISLSEFEYLWGMGKGDKVMQKEKISNISFAQPDITKELIIFVDQIEIVKEEAMPIKTDKKASGVEANVIKVLDDFERGTGAWQGGGSGDMKFSVESTTTAKEGKKAMKISFTGRRTPDSWLNLGCAVGKWPKEANQISFWAKAEKRCKVRTAMVESAWPEMEIYIKVVEMGTEWQRFSIPVSDYNVLEWGMEKGNKKFEPEKVTSFGFRPDDLPATIYIDQIQFEQVSGGSLTREEEDKGHHKDEKMSGDSSKDYKEEKSEGSQIKEAKFPFIVDNFEGAHLKKWRKQDSGGMKSNIEFSDDAKEGKKSAKVSFTGTKEEGSWLNLFYDIGVGNWPKGGNVITFWAKASKKCKVLLKINQGAQHDEWEFYGSKELTIGTDWKKYSLNIKDTANLIWGHLEPSSGKIIPEAVYGIGFDAVDFPVEFLVDQLQIEKGEK